MQTTETLAPPATNGAHPAHKFWWDVETYERACQMGLFDGHRVELIEGEINDLNAHSKPHIVGVGKTYERLREIFPKADYVLTGQSTLYSDERSRPEPDIAVFRGDWNDIMAEAPMLPILVVEVSLETIAYDQGDKASFYAKLGVRDYWVLDLRADRLEVRRNAKPDAAQRHGAAYDAPQIFGRGAKVSPLELPQVAIEVADLLP